MVTIRGTCANRTSRGATGAGDEATLAAVERRCRALVKEFGTNISLRLEVCADQGLDRPPHDRFWLGRSGNSPCRVMTSSNSVIQGAYATRLRGKPSELTVTSHRGTIQMRTREWNDSTPLVVCSVESPESTSSGLSPAVHRAGP
jgi:hypothetical protein